MVIAVTWVAAFVLVLAGIRKLTRPGAAGATLQAARLPSDNRLVRGLGAAELLLGLCVLVGGGAIPLASLAVAYGAFAVFAYRQRRDGADCGCFGATGTPVTASHVWLDVIAAAAAAFAATQPAPALATVAAEQPVAGLTTGALVVATGHLVRLLLTAAPDLAAARSLLEPDDTA